METLANKPVNVLVSSLLASFPACKSVRRPSQRAEKNFLSFSRTLPMLFVVIVHARRIRAVFFLLDYPFA